MIAQESSPSSTLPPLIRLESVSKAYSTAAGSFLALNEVTLQVQAGEFLGITGKSGAGKTTLVNMITGTDQITSGEVWVGEICVHSMGEDRRARWRGRNIGVVYQSFHLMPAISLIDNIMLPMDFCGQYVAQVCKARALDLLRQMELEQHARKLPSEISGGQQQRVAIARALANDPAVIVADEPTGRLDSVTADVIFGIFRELVSQGKTIVMVSHDNGLASRVDRVLKLNDGALDGRPEIV